MEKPSGAIDVEAIAERLRTRAGDFFSAFRGTDPIVELVWKSVRLNSVVTEFRIQSSHVQHSVIVKIPTRRGNADSGGDAGLKDSRLERPRLYPRAPKDIKGEWEFGALTAIDRECRRLADPRFGSIRPLERVVSDDVIILEKCPHPSLKSLIAGRSRWTNRTGRTMPSVFRNVGAWLRFFHSLPPSSWARTRNAHIDDFVASIERFANYLKRQMRTKTLVDDIAVRVQRAAQARLPTNLPLAVVHGDFAGRNILVSPEDQISVLDTMACWHAPWLEDVAYFCLSLRLNGIQVATRGFWHSEEELHDWENAFVQGYFGSEPVPWSSIRLFECLLALERWCALKHRHGSTVGPRRWSSQVRLLFWEPFLRRHILGLVNRIEASDDNK